MEEAKTSHPKRFDLHLGADVYSADDKRVGRVDEVTVEHFKVAVDRAPDYWLSNATIGSVRSGEVHLAYAADAVEGFRLDGPGAQAGDPAADGALNVFDSRADQARSREAMERADVAPPKPRF